MRVTHDDKKTVIYFDSITWDDYAFRDEIIQYLRNSTSSRIVLDFSNLEDVEMKILEMMGEIAERYRKKDYSFVIKNPDKKLIQQLVLSGLTRFFFLKFK